MHMADALLSPAVGGGMWAVTAATIAYSARRLKRDLDDSKIPLMGVLAAFIFAAQMVNFTIPGTGSSGHLGGGLILAILLGPYAGFLAMASVLTVQALFFADGGLLALGCNIFNLGFCACFIAYPLVYRPLVGHRPTSGRILAGAITAAIVSLQLGAFGVVLETMASGISALPFATFALLMQPIHLAIGIVEGLVTAMVIGFIWKARPELMGPPVAPGAPAAIPMRRLLWGLLAVTVITGGVLSWFASTHPDGLEWAVAHTTGRPELAAPVDRVHRSLANLQEQTAVLPAYGARPEADATTAKARTSLAGLLGGGLTLLLAAGLGLGVRHRALSAKRRH